MSVRHMARSTERSVETFSPFRSTDLPPTSSSPPARMEVVSLRALTALRTLVGIEVVVAMTNYFLVGKAFRTFTCSFNDGNVTTSLAPRTRNSPPRRWSPSIPTGCSAGRCACGGDSFCLRLADWTTNGVMKFRHRS